MTFHNSGAEHDSVAIPGHIPEFVELQSTLGEVSCGALSVVVDFNELLSVQGEERAFELIGKLKDLLP